jgi:predicted ATPase/DNA-binding SARP family transcriptional activator
MDFRILGPLEVCDRGRLLELRRRKHRALLAALLLRAGEVVSTDTLLEELWGERPPATAKGSLQNMVSALRKVLGNSVLRTQPPGYLLDVERAQVDLFRFARLLEEVRSAADTDQRAAMLREALALWRGPPLADLAFEPFVLREAPRLEELRVAAEEELIEARLALGEDAALVRELEALVAEHPFNERFYSQLMTALYRSGRQTDALELYRRLRRLLMEELGLEPSLPLREPQRAILRHDAAVAPAWSSSLRPLRNTAAILDADTEWAGAGPPSGTVTFLLSDLDGSTRLLRSLGRATFTNLVAQHDRLLSEVWSRYSGYEVDTAVDGFFVVFREPSAAVRAAAEAQRALGGASWPERVEPRIRIGMHAGKALLRDGKYVGVPAVRAARVMSAGHGGQVLVSQAVADLCADEPLGDLELRDLGLHWLKDLDEPQHLYQLVVPGLRSAFPPPRTRRQTNLPRPAWPLLGRKTELSELVEVVSDEGRRLVTVTGAGGTGKTRLALEVASTLLEAFPDGTFFVPLAPLSDPAQVPAAVVAALPVQEQPGRPLGELLSEYLASRRLLLLLDNFEHLLAAAPLVAELLAAAPSVQVLATSREPLHVAGECEYPLQPLSESAASQLFAARVRDSVPDFALDDRNRKVVTLICRRLDGLPLALELAAGRLKLLGLQGLVDRLEQRIELLAGDRRDVPERQQTLRATIQWSYDLLSEGEQAVFLALSVFAGGFTLEAAEAVCDACLEVVGSLLEKSLLRRRETAAGDVRFWMLQTIRDFGLDELERSGHLHVLRDSHLRYFRELAELAEPELRRAEQVDWLRRLDGENENLRAALAHALGESGDVRQAARLAVALLEFWDARAHFNEAESWFNLLIVRRSELDAALAARVALARASIASRRGDRRSQIRHAANAALAFRALAAPAHEAWALDSLTYGLLYSREPQRKERAAAAAERAHEAAEESGDPQAICHALGAAANVATFSEGDEERATSIYEEMARIYRDLGDRHKHGIVLVNLAESALMQADFEHAETLLVDAIAAAREIDDGLVAVYCLSRLAAARLLQDRFDAAQPALEEALAAAFESGMADVLALSLSATALLAARSGEATTAAKLIGASEHVRGLNASPAPFEERVAREARVATELVLGADASDAIAEARTLAPGDAVEAALEALARCAAETPIWMSQPVRRPAARHASTSDRRRERASRRRDA